MEKVNVDFVKLMISQGVYSKLKNIDDETWAWICEKGGCSTIDYFCPICKSNKTFIFSKKETHKNMGYIVKTFNSDGSLIRTIDKESEWVYCCPTCGARVVFYFYYDNDLKSIIKVGQYPSLYDLSRDELKEFQKSNLISDDDIGQLYKAYTCASESYFVAAYTYMRRVFENLLIDVFKDNVAKIGLSEVDFNKLRSNEKLEKLKEYLAIDDEIYKPLYALLSVGIHALTEEECAENFELLKSILLDILAEQKAKKEKEEKRKQIKLLYSKKEAERKANNNATDER